MNFNAPLVSSIQFGVYPRSHAIVAKSKVIAAENAIREGTFRPIPRQLLRVRRLPKSDIGKLSGIEPNLASKDFSSHPSRSLWQKGVVGLIAAAGVYMLAKAGSQYFSFPSPQADFAGYSAQSPSWPISILSAQFLDLFPLPVRDPQSGRFLPQSEILMADVREKEKNYPLMLWAGEKECPIPSDTIPVSTEALRDQNSRHLLFQFETKKEEAMDPSFPLLLSINVEKHGESTPRPIRFYEGAPQQESRNSTGLARVSRGPRRRIVDLTSCKMVLFTPFEKGESSSSQKRESQSAKPFSSQLNQKRNEERSIWLKEVPDKLTTQIVPIDTESSIETGQAVQKIGGIALEVLESVGIFLAVVSASWIWRVGRATASVALEKISKPFIFPNAPLPQNPPRKHKDQRKAVSPPGPPPLPFSGPSSTMRFIPVREEIRLTPPAFFVQEDVPVASPPMPLEELLRDEQPGVEERRLLDALIPPAVPNDARPDHLLGRVEVQPDREEPDQARLSRQAETATRPDVVIPMNEEPEEEVWVDIPLDDDDRIVQEEEDPVLERYQQMQARLQERGSHVVIHMPDDGAIVDMTDDPFELTRQPRYSRLTVFVILLFDQMWRWVARTLRV